MYGLPAWFIHSSHSFVINAPYVFFHRFVEMFGRTKLIAAEGPRWIDFPFTREEAMLATTSNKISMTC